MQKNDKVKSLITLNLKTLFISSLIVGCVLSTSTNAQTDDSINVNSQSDNEADVNKTPIPLTQIKAFADVFTRIKNSYVEPVSDEQLLDYAISGMLSGLDPHSVFC